MIKQARVWLRKKLLGLQNYDNGPVGGNGWDLLRNFLFGAPGEGNTSAGVHVSQKSMMGYPPAWRAINIIVNDVGKLPLDLFKRIDDDSREKDRRHPAYRLLRRKPNPWMSAGTFIKTLTYHALSVGNGYAHIGRDQGGNPIRLSPLVPHETYPVLEDNETLWYVTRAANGELRKIPARDILHIHGLSYDGIMGHSVIDLMREALGLGMAARKFITLYFGQGLNNRGFIIVPKRLDDKERKDLRESWTKMNTGLSESHLPAVLHGGMDFKPTSTNPDEAQALETRQLEIREAANIFGVRPHKLGDTTRTSYNSLEMENQSHLDEAIDPWLQVWEEECFEKLLTEQQKEEESHYVEFNRDALLRVDAKTQSEINRKERESGISSVNDILRRKNRPTIGPEGDVRHIPGNWRALTSEPTKEEAAAAEPETDDTPNDEDVQNKRQAALRDLIVDKLQRLIKVEARQITEAAGRGKNFVDWMDDFYERHTPKLIDAITPLIRVCDLEAEADELAAELVDDHILRARSNLLDMADGDREGFTDRVGNWATAWLDSRPAEFTEAIMGERSYAEVSEL